ncbi:hypothetical protein MMC20_004038 [Loxospora ochrophaea]|nr:hypothetical protein [Loxospora ochrophaea]
MPAISWQALRFIPRSLSPEAYLLINRRGLPQTNRAFHAYSNLKSPHDDTSDKPEFSHNKAEEPQESPQAPEAHSHNWGGDQEAEKAESAPEKPSDAREVREDVESSEKSIIEPPTKIKDTSNYGSAKNRAWRNTPKPKDPPRITIPRSFLETNVRFCDEIDADRSERIHITAGDPSTGRIELSETAKGSESTEGFPQPPTGFLPQVQDADSSAPSYSIEGGVFGEVKSRILAGLYPLPPQNAGNLQVPKRDLFLHCPKDGGTYFLDLIISTVATAAKADLITLDAQDIAEIGSSFLREPTNTQLSSLQSLGYNAHLMLSQTGNEEDSYEEDGESNENDEDEANRPRSRPSIYSTPSARRTGPFHVAALVGGFKDLFKYGGANSPQGSTPTSTGPFRAVKPPAPTAEQSDETHVSNFLDAILDAANQKRRDLALKGNQHTSSESETISDLQVSNEREGKSTDSIGHESNSTILVVRDYWEINATFAGNRILSKLHELLDKRRQEGRRIMVVGTTSSEDLIPTLSKSGFKMFESEPDFKGSKMIVTPLRTPENQELLDHHRKVRTLEINTRHLYDSLQKMTADSQRIARNEISLDSAEIYTSGLDENIWTLERIHRLASITLGLVFFEGQQMSLEHLKQALQIMDESDNAKFEWVNQEKEEERRQDEDQSRSRSGPQKNREEGMKKLRRACNSHEKKLLAGVINAENIKTTFTDVRAPPETIEALQTLTSLSLIRPEAFRYGVLATDKIPGLLLYGPPGTGKTLLAKAVAKESGATVLEVSGSDIYDMYVGEGEKNVRAVFSLAKKLSPCIVFIDEADAIFGSRSASVNRTSHRELINQFLREWDGMNDLSAFIMVATNRPFDLDDAVLRRLPRRLLVDLPVEKDREAILDIHLKDEQLDSTVFTSVLAAQTPFYSGSDLKNLAVAAALACVKEENESAAAAAKLSDATEDSVTPLTYPAKRTLSKRHFDKAMTEIGASVSEDMSSLAAIKKFDERFGERRGRRKGKGYGFATLSEEEREKISEEVGRVRHS